MTTHYKSLISAQDKEICLIDEGNSYNAITPPIVQSSLFSFKCFEDYRNYHLHKHQQYVYTRGNNPTTNVLEDKLARLEQGETCRVFASGMAAISAAIIGHLKTGDHIIFFNTIYAPTMIYAGFLERFGITHSYLRTNNLDELSSAIRSNTKMIYVESPGSLDIQVVDLRKLVKIAHEHNLLSVIDNTFATPLYQKPLTLGVDIVVHSCTKYIGGHADVMAGAVITSRKLMHDIDIYAFKLHGAVLSPHDSFLLIRGLRTMPARLEALQLLTAKVVEFLLNHPRVLKVNHPLAYNEEEKAIYWSQANGYTGLISFELDISDYTALARFIDGLITFHLGFSWGGYENLVMAPYVADDYEKIQVKGLKPNLVRISLGLLDSETIINDLEQALAKI